MPTGRLIVCESTGAWARALARELSGAALRIRESPLLEALDDELRGHERSFVVLELTLHRLADALPGIRRWSQRHGVLVAAVGSPELRWLDLWARDAGAIDTAFTWRRLRLTARLIERHLAGCETADPTPAERARRRLTSPRHSSWELRS